MAVEADKKSETNKNPLSNPEVSTQLFRQIGLCDFGQF
jgi:hypothetical protein